MFQLRWNINLIVLVHVVLVIAHWRQNNCGRALEPLLLSHWAGRILSHSQVLVCGGGLLVLVISSVHVL